MIHVNDRDTRAMKNTYQNTVARNASNGYFHATFGLNKLRTLSSPAAAQSSSFSVDSLQDSFTLLQNNCAYAAGRGASLHMRVGVSWLVRNDLRMYVRGHPCWPSLEMKVNRIIC